MLIDEDQHAPWTIIRLTAAVNASIFIDRTNDELPVKLVYHLHTGEVILLKTPGGRFIGDGEGVVNPAHGVCGTRGGYNVLGSKGGRVWKSLRDRRYWSLFDKVGRIILKIYRQFRRSPAGAVPTFKASTIHCGGPSSQSPESVTAIVLRVRWMACALSSSNSRLSGVRGYE